MIWYDMMWYDMICYDTILPDAHAAVCGAKDKLENVRRMWEYVLTCVKEEEGEAFLTCLEVCLWKISYFQST